MAVPCFSELSAYLSNPREFIFNLHETSIQLKFSLTRLSTFSIKFAYFIGSGVGGVVHKAWTPIDQDVGIHRALYYFAQAGGRTHSHLAL